MKETRFLRKCVIVTIVAACAALAVPGQSGPEVHSPKELSAQKSTPKPTDELGNRVLRDNDSKGLSTPAAAANPVTENTAPRPHVIVVGFTGGFVGRNNLVHSPVQVAARLREEHRGDVVVKVFENRRREEAHREILSLLDADHDGSLSAEEKKSAQIILYGMSWGGSETISLARELEREQIPVLLTVQVDSVAKIQQNDEVIPANVVEAANFFQTDGLLHGQTRIRAADATRTKILGNFRMEYKAQSFSCKQYPWWDKIFVKYHTEIECDEAVWNRVESMIRTKLPE